MFSCLPQLYFNVPLTSPAQPSRLKLMMLCDVFISMVFQNWPICKRQVEQHNNIKQGNNHCNTQPPRKACLRIYFPIRKNDYYNWDKNNDSYNSKLCRSDSKHNLISFRLLFSNGTDNRFGKVFVKSGWLDCWHFINYQLWIFYYIIFKNNICLFWRRFRF